MKVEHIPCGAYANESERNAVDYLIRKMRAHPSQDRWVLLSNVLYAVNARAMPSEIDIIAVGPQGVFVIETKHWDREFLGKQQAVVLHEGDKLHKKSEKIVSAVRKAYPPYGFLAGSFLLTKETQTLGDKNRPKVAESNFFVLSEWQLLLNINGPSAFPIAQVDQIVKAIEPRTKAALSGEISRLANVTDMKLLTSKEERFHRIYRGQDTIRRKPVLLHLYDLSAFNGANADRIARREAEKLQAYQESPYIPRVLETFREVPEYPGELYFFTMADPDAACLQKRTEDKSWNLNQRAAFSFECFKALAGLQDLGLLHRNITPQTLLVQASNRPLFTGLHLAKSPDSVTVWPPAVPAPDPYQAPEINGATPSQADKRSDVFSMAATLATIFNSSNTADDSTDDTKLRQAALAALTPALAEDPAKRADAQKVQLALAAVAGQRVPAIIPDARFWSADLVVEFGGHSYRLGSKLGSGSFGSTFQVVQIDPQNNEEFGSYVAKVIYDPKVANLALRAYKRVKQVSAHAALALVYETAPAWEANRFVALMRWINGDPLQQWAGLVEPVADEQKLNAEELVLTWCKTLCQGLTRLHQSGLVHGDVSPKNILWDGKCVVLTDYDTVCRVGEARWTQGTPLFTPPGTKSGSIARASDDVYSLATSLFHVVFDRSAFDHELTSRPDLGACWSGIDRDLWPTFAHFVDHAIAPDPQQRFPDAMAALAWLVEQAEVNSLRTTSALAENPPQAQIAPPSNTTVAGNTATDAPSHVSDTSSDSFSHSSNAVTPLTVLQPNQVTWLKQILKTYPGGQYGNIETRGLDSKFAEQTYVQTALDTALLEDIKAGRVRLVVLCGNAGDGKTAMLQHILAGLGVKPESSSHRVRDQVLPGGMHVRANLDGSAAYKDKNADDLLDELFKPFQSGLPNTNLCHLLAVNDGRLLEWVESFEGRHQNQSTWLTKRLREVLDKEGIDETDGLRFIDLNARSLVGGSDGKSVTHTFLDQLLDKMLGGSKAEEIWKPCATCSAKIHCPVKQSVDRLMGNNGHSRNLVRQRIYDALQAVHQRGEVHITARELRGTLSYIFFGTQYCTHIHEDTDLPHYPEMAFSPTSPMRQGGVLGELARLDPALDAHPHIDRSLKLEAISKAHGLTPSVDQLAAERRRAYFEWSDARIVEVAGDKLEFGLYRGRHLTTFRNVAIMPPKDRANVLEDICAGISRLEDLPPIVFLRKGRVALKISPRTPVESSFWVEKPLDRFELQTEQFDPTPGLETMHRYLRLIYHYADTPGLHEVLLINSDLFHLLMDLRDGYQIADARSDDTFANLSIFTQRIAQEDERSVFAWNPIDELQIYEVGPKLHNGVQRLSLVLAEKEAARGQDN
jgi:serine/threonine protein kinase